MRLRISVAASIHMFSFGAASLEGSEEASGEADWVEESSGALRIAALRWSGVIETPRSSASSSAHARPMKPG